MKRAAVPLAVLALLVVLFWRGLSLDPTEVPSPLIGRPAPTFDLESVTDPGRRVRLDDHLPGPLLVNVWGSWCVGCHEEHAMLMRIAESGSVPILGINWKDEREDALRFLERYGDPYVASARDYDGDVAIDWGVYGAPETFIVGGDGTVLYKHVGPITQDVWQQEMLPLIRGPGSSS